MTSLHVACSKNAGDDNDAACVIKVKLNFPKSIATAIQLTYDSLSA